jgi:hypothetical protein
MMLIMLMGYQLRDRGDGHLAVSYDRAARVEGAAIAAVPFLLLIGLTVISPPYMAQFFDFPIGLSLLLITLALLAALAGGIWLGIWKDRAQTGISISVLAFVAGWSASIAIWLILLGPAYVRVTHEFWGN